jgi:hypothetical protein
MANWFEDLTKTVADDKLPRRQAMRRMAGSVTGMALASWLPGQVLAKDIPWKKQCPGTCNCSDPNGCGCHGNPNTNCFCFPSMEGNPVCICDTFCSQLPTCSSSSQCKKGFICITNNGCTGCSTSYGVCIAKCKGKHKNCQLGSGHGMTITGRGV